VTHSIRRGVPTGLEEIAQLGRTLWRRRDDILAFFDQHASNGPTEAINGRLEALRRNALGFRNLTHYRWRSLPHNSALHPLINALQKLRRAVSRPLEGAGACSHRT
jgi:transposase